MIVQNLVRLLDGEIEVETKTGHGTKITVGMKLRYGTESKDAAEEIQYFDWSDWESARERKTMFSGQHVLVVDDNDITASIEEQILTERGLVGWLCNNNGNTTASRGWKDGSSDCVVFPVICRR